MASQKGQRKAATNRPSARLSISPGDEWRSWSKLPADAPPVADAGNDDEDDESDEEPIDLDDLTRFSGSMMVVGAQAEAPAPPAPEAPAPPTPGPAVAQAPPAAPAPAPPAPAPPDNEAIEARARALAAEMTAKAEALAKAELAATAKADAEARAAAESRIAELQRTLAAAEAQLAEAAERQRADERRSAEVVARQTEEASGPTLPMRHRGAAANRHTTGALDRSSIDADAEASSHALASVAFVLDSDQSAPRRPQAERPTPVATATAAGESRAHAVTVDSDFEERVRVAFMQLVERIEQLERQGDSAPRAIVTNTNTAADDAIVAFLGQRQAELAAGFDELATRQDELLAGQHRLRDDHRSLAEQHIQLAELERSLVEQQSDTSHELERTLARIAELSTVVEQSTRAIPIVEGRVVGLEAEVSSGVRNLAGRVDELTRRFPAVEDAVEIARRNVDALAALAATVQQFSDRIDSELAAFRDQLTKFDDLETSITIATATADKTNADFLRLQAEVDRHTDSVESRLVELEDVVGNEAGVDRQLLLDRIEEIERGITELDPDHFAKTSELDQLRAQLAGRVEPSDRAED